MRITIPIAADPRSETDRRGVEWQPPAGRPAECRIERAKVAGEGVPDRLLEDQEAARDLVERIGLSRADFFRFPRRGDFTAQLLDRLRALRHGQVRAIEPHQRVRDVQVLVNQRAPGDLRRMRREHELDPQRARSLVKGLRRHAAGYQARKGLLARRRLRAGCRIALIVSPPPHAMVLLGDIRQRKEVGERSRDGQCSFHRQVPQDARERADIVSLTRSSILRQRSHALDRVEERLSLAQPQRVAEQFAQHPHIVPQRRVWIHGAIVSQSAVFGRWSAVAVDSHSRQSSVNSRRVVSRIPRTPNAERRTPNAERRPHFNRYSENSVTTFKSNVRNSSVRPLASNVSRHGSHWRPRR